MLAAAPSPGPQLAQRLGAPWVDREEPDRALAMAFAAGPSKGLTVTVHVAADSSAASGDVRQLDMTVTLTAIDVEHPLIAATRRGAGRGNSEELVAMTGAEPRLFASTGSPRGRRPMRCLRAQWDSRADR
jgi:hypothetical protein